MGGNVSAELLESFLCYDLTKQEEERMGKCLSLSWKSSMETTSGLTCRRYRVLEGSVVPGSTGFPLPCRHVAKG